MRGCMICETPYGVLNCLNYIYHKNRKSSSFDIYIGDNFMDSQETAERIKKCRLFEHVWRYRKRPENDKFFPRNYIENAVVDIDYHFSAYDEVYLTSATGFPVHMILECKDADVYFMDDGLKSYIGEIYVEPLSKMEKWYCLFTGRDYRRIFPKVVYLNCIGLCMDHVGYEVRQLENVRRSENCFAELLSYVFHYVPSGYYAGRRMIYLAQPIEADLKLPEISRIDQKIESALVPFKEEVLYRPHPRQTYEGGCDFRIDQEQSMWELVCMSEISDETILIGPYSTALFIPKMMCDKEPWLIFTYELYREYLGNREKSLFYGIEEMVQHIRQIYRDPDKVICVKKAEDLEKCVRKIRASDPVPV